MMNILGRGSGVTTAQVKALKERALFVWCNDSMSYIKGVIQKTGRQDVRVLRLSDLLTPDIYAGITYPEIVLDHACLLSPAKVEGFIRLRAGARELKETP